MAKCEVKLPDEIFEKLAQIGDKTEDVIKKMLEAGAKPVLAAAKANLKSVIGRGIKTKPRSTGELLSSLGISHVDVDKRGISNVKIGFAEPRKHQYKPKYTKPRKSKDIYKSSDVAKRGYYTITNAMIASVLEYGKHNQPAKPFMKPAERSSKGACIKAMETKFDEIVGKLQ